jgi:hypothetical protein
MRPARFRTALISRESGILRDTHIAVLLVNMTELEPDVPRCQRPRGIVEDVPEALWGFSRIQNTHGKLTSRLWGYLRWCL